ncbi:MAG: class I SAM-dependent methyltransferase [Patescibacteria group bacterium]
MQLIIPPKRLMTKTNDEDPVFFHYYPIARIVYRKRLQNTLSLIPQGKKFKHLLEIGYGSGIFLPTLAGLADEVTALDIHPETEAVTKMLDFYKLRDCVHLVSGDIMKMPFADNAFDCCVIVSTLENIENSGQAVSEIARVVQPGGDIVISFPVENMLTDLLFRIAGEDPRKIHPSNHRYILEYLRKNFDITQILHFPSIIPLNASLYISLHCRNNGLKQYDA